MTENHVPLGLSRRGRSRKVRFGLATKKRKLAAVTGRSISQDPTLHTGNVIVHGRLKIGSQFKLLMPRTSCFPLSRRLSFSGEMDPISLTASTIAIIQLTTDLIKVTKDYYKGVKNAPREIAELIEESTNFGKVLEQLKTTLQAAESAERLEIARNGLYGIRKEASRLPMLQEMMRVDGPLTSCHEEMLAFKTKLSQNPSTVRRSLKWPIERDETRAIISRLRHLKSVLDTAIASDQL